MTTGGPIIEAQALSHRYGTRQALQDINLEVKPGESFGLVGPDGAGKSTLLKLVVGLLRVQSGQLRAESGPGMGYIPQRFSLYPDLSVGENIDFFARLYGLRDFANRKKELLEFVDMQRFESRLAAQLSGGMKQKLALVAALIHQPTLLIMDEPTTGVDPVSRREFWNVVFGRQKQGLTVLASTPYMDEAEQFDRVMLLDAGRCLSVGTTAEIKASVPGGVLYLRCPQTHQARKALQGAADIADVQLFGEALHVFVAQADDTACQNVRVILAKANLEVTLLEPRAYSIEDVFLKVSV
jgi:ABC-2 type transport system ATP-binding protein